MILFAVFYVYIAALIFYLLGETYGEPNPLAYDLCAASFWPLTFTVLALFSAFEPHLPDPDDEEPQ